MPQGAALCRLHSTAYRNLNQAISPLTDTMFKRAAAFDSRFDHYLFEVSVLEINFNFRRQRTSLSKDKEELSQDLSAHFQW